MFTLSRHSYLARLSALTLLLSLLGTLWGAVLFPWLAPSRGTESAMTFAQQIPQLETTAPTTPACRCLMCKAHGRHGGGDNPKNCCCQPETTLVLRAFCDATSTPDGGMAPVAAASPVLWPRLLQCPVPLTVPVVLLTPTSDVSSVASRLAAPLPPPPRFRS